MERRVTEADLANFAAVGFPSQVSPADAPPSAQLMESTLRVFEAPSARLVEAGMLALAELARRDELNVVHEFRLSGDVARRLGFVAERMGDELNDQRLRDFAQFVTKCVAPEDTAPLVLVDSYTASYLRHLVAHADAVSARWGVFGRLNFRFLVDG